MRIHRPTNFSEYKGNVKKINSIRNRIASNNLSQAILLYGEEGLGKSTLSALISLSLNCTSYVKPCGECNNCKSIINNVINANKDTVNVKTFKMSVEGGKESAKDVLSELNTNFIQEGVKVVRLEECHRMSKEAQDTVLSDIEYLPKGVFLIATTTDLSSLQKTFLSRFVTYHLERPSLKEVVDMLEYEANRRELNVLGGKNSLEMIARWTDCKPRASLKILEMFGDKSNVTHEDVKDILSFTDIKKVIPIFTSLAGSVVVGINAINDLDINMKTQDDIIFILEESIKISQGYRTTKLSPEDTYLVREAIKNTETERIVNLLYKVASVREFTRAGFLASYLSVHPMLSKIDNGMNQSITEEYQSISANVKSINGVEDKIKRAPSLTDLMGEGSIVE